MDGFAWSRGGRRARWPKALAVLALVGVGAVIALSIASDIYTEYLWFGSFGFQGVYTKILWSKLVVGLTVGLAVGLFFAVNLIVMRRILLSELAVTPAGVFASSRPARALSWSIAVVAALVAGSAASSGYLDFLRYAAAEPFGIADPIFGRDVGFYVFKLPLLLAFYRGFLSILLGVLSLCFVVYFASSFRGNFFHMPHRANVHLSVLLALFFVVKAWGFHLDALDLVFSERGVVFGASYTDLHAQLPAYRILLVISLVCALIMVVDIFIKGVKVTVGSVATLVVG